MKHKIIQLFCLLILFACQKNDIEVFNGSNTNLDKLEGNWIVINYWADWCAPCIKEIPELNEFAHENKDIFVFTFNFDHLDQEDLAPIAKKFNIEVPSLVTHPRDIWGIDLHENVPTTYIIKNNKIIETITTPLTLEDLENKLASYSTFD